MPTLSRDMMSQEMQEVMQTLPAAPVRWGAILVLLALVGTLIVAVRMPLPDKVVQKIQLISDSDMVPVWAPLDGAPGIWKVEAGQEVLKGDPLVIMAPEDIWANVQLLESQLDNYKRKISEGAAKNYTFPNALDLGNLTPDYQQFLVQIREYSETGTIRPTIVTSGSRSEIQDLEEALKRDKAAIDTLVKLQLLREKEMKPLQEQLAYSAAGSSEEALINRQLQGKRQVIEDIKNKIITYRSQEEEKIRLIRSHRNNIQEANLQAAGAKVSSIGLVEGAVDVMRSRINRWKSENTILSPDNGQVYWPGKKPAIGKKLPQNSALLYLAPVNSSERFEGQMSLPVHMAGKVDTGQAVIIRLAGYDVWKYGTIEGKIASKSLVPQNDSIVLQITLPETLETTKGKVIQFELQMKGVGEIIVDETPLFRRLLGRLF